MRRITPPVAAPAMAAVLECEPRTTAVVGAGSAVGTRREDEENCGGEFTTVVEVEKAPPDDVEVGSGAVIKGY